MNDLPLRQPDHVRCSVGDRSGAVHVKSALDETGCDRVRREAEVLSELSHPNVIELVTSGPTELVTRLAGRRTLADPRRNTTEQVAAWARALLQILTDLHAVGWTHGGIDATHLIVGNDGRLTVCSWRRAARRPAGHVGFEQDRDALRMVIEGLAREATPPTNRSARHAAAQVDQVLDALGSPLTRIQQPQPARPHRPGVATMLGPALTTVAGAVLAWVLISGFGAGAVSGTGPVAIAAGALRWTAAAGAAYLAVISAVLTGARVLDATRVATLALAALPTPLRRALLGLVGAGVVSLALPRPAPTPSPPAAHVSSTPTANTTTSSSAPATTTPTTIAATATAAPAAAAPSTPPAAATPTAIAPEPGRSTHRIEAGEHLWGIAGRTMRSRLGREPTERETARYWVRLVDTNRDRLPDPDNPDLLFTGGTVVLPD